MIINKYLQIFAEEYVASKTIDKLIQFTKKTLPADGTDKIFIGCVLIMFEQGFLVPQHLENIYYQLLNQEMKRLVVQIF